MQPLHRLPGEIGAEHVEGAMREIDHAHDSKYQRQSRGDQKQKHGGGQAAHELAEQKGWRHRLPAFRHHRVTIVDPPPASDAEISPSISLSGTTSAAVPDS